MTQGSQRLLFIIPAALVLMVVLTYWSSQSRNAQTSSVGGKNTVLATFGVGSGDALDTARALQSRLGVYGIDSSLNAVDGGQVQLEVRRVAEPEPLLNAILSSEPIQLHFVSRDQGGTPVDPPDGSITGGDLSPWLAGRSRREVLERIATLRADAGEAQAVLECIPPPDKDEALALCAAWQVGPPLPIGVADIAAANIRAHPRTEEPLVSLTFSERAAKALSQAIAEHPDQMLAVVALGELQARPVPDETLEANTLTFSTRTGDTHRRAAVERAERIVAATRLQPVTGVTLEGVTRAQPSRPAAP